MTAQSKYLSGITLTDGVNGLAANYTTPTLDRDNSAAVTINPKEVKLSASKVFDGTNTLSSVNIFTDGSNGYLSDETLLFQMLFPSIHVENGNNRIKPFLWKMAQVVMEESQPTMNFPKNLLHRMLLLQLSKH